MSNPQPDTLRSAWREFCRALTAFVELRAEALLKWLGIFPKLQRALFRDAVFRTIGPEATKLVRAEMEKLQRGNGS